MDCGRGYKKTPHLFILMGVFSVCQIKNNFRLSTYHWFASMALTQHVFLTVTTWDIPMVWYISIHQSSRECERHTIRFTRRCRQRSHRETKFSFNCSEPNLLQLIYLSQSCHGIIVRMLHFLIL